MAVQRDRPYLGCHFRVEIVGRTQAIAAGFCEVVFPDFVAARPAKVAGRAEHAAGGSNLVLRRGVQGALDLYAWFDEARRATPRGKATARRDLHVVLLDETHTVDALRWFFTGVRPVRLSYSPLQSQAGEVLIETIELEFERMEMA
jgi:phage tail-like protein